MSSNQCPVCQQEAMDAMTKLMKRPHVCQNCGVEQRMNLIYTSVVSIIFFPWPCGHSLLQDFQLAPW